MYTRYIFVLPWMAVYIRYLKIIRIDHMISGNNYLSLIRLILWFKIGLATILELWVGFFASTRMWTGPYCPNYPPGPWVLLVQLWNYHVHCRISSYIKCLYTFIVVYSSYKPHWLHHVFPAHPSKSIQDRQISHIPTNSCNKADFCYFRIYVHQYTPTTLHTKMKSGLFQTKLGIWRRIIENVGHITGHILSNWFTFGNFERILEIDKGSRIRLSENEYSNW